MKDRLFVPLNSIWFDLFKSGEKEWELRGISKLFNTKTVFTGRYVEIRRGYRGESLFGVVVDTFIIWNFSEIPPDIFNKVIPLRLQDKKDLMAFLDDYEEKYLNFILFKVEIYEKGKI